MSSRWVRWWRGVLFAGLLVGPAWAAPVLPAPSRLLVFVDTAVASPWYARFLEALRLAVHQRHPDVELDVDTLPDGLPTAGGALPPWMLQKYAGRRYDIVLGARPDVIDPVVRLRDQLWPHATVVAPLANAAQLASVRDVPRLTGLQPNDSVAATLSLVFRLLPKTAHVAVIARTLDQDPLRPNWRRSLAVLDGRATLIDLSGLPIEQLRERVRTLPPDTVLFFAAPGATVGRVATPRDLLGELARQSDVPMFVDTATMLGTGVVGGAVISPEALAQDVARQVDALLDGTPPERIGLQPQSPLRTVFDWRALQRWRIPLDRLPQGSEVIERPPGLWEAYRVQVLGGGAVLAVQSALIAALLLERRRRRRAELQSREHLSHLARLNRGAALGALSAALAHEINQPLGAILSTAETAELLLERPGEAPREALRELLAAIREDDQRAAAVLQRLRAWLANAPATLQPVALNPLVQDVARLLATELRLRETELVLALAPHLPDVTADAVQVQQVVLNLVLNALDALQAVPPRQRRVTVATTLRGDHTVAISVSDNGPGLAGVPAQRLFEPFFTTKPDGLGVGLAISRSIAEQHGGRLQAEDGPGGACFRFTLPAVGAA